MEMACPYCEGEGCSECDGTGRRFVTLIEAGNGVSGNVTGSAPLTAEGEAAMRELLRAAADQLGP